MRKLLISLALLVPVALAAQTNQEPYPTILRSEKGAPISATEYDDTIRALRNFFTQTEGDYHLFVPGGTTLPATCDTLQLWVHQVSAKNWIMYLGEDDGAAGCQWTVVSNGGMVAVNQAAHGFSANQWIQFDAVADTWELLDIDTAEDSYAVAYVISVLGANDFVLLMHGEVEVTHGLPVGPLYASSTGGIAAGTPPALGNIEWVIGVAIDSDTILVQQKEWIR
jgi:hypothetical protein